MPNFEALFILIVKVKNLLTKAGEVPVDFLLRKRCEVEISIAINRVAPGRYDCVSSATSCGSRVDRERWCSVVTGVLLGLLGIDWVMVFL